MHLMSVDYCLLLSELVSLEQADLEFVYVCKLFRNIA